MEQLSGLDSVFLAAESSRTPMHVSAVLTYEPDATDQKGDSVFDRVRSSFESSLDASEIFRRKPIKTPMHYDHPYWADDDQFDLDNHIHELELPNPGDWQEFRAAITRLHAQPLNLDRPLWEAHVIQGLNAIEGMQDRSFAILLKMHHAAIDGVTMTKVIAALHMPDIGTEPDTTTEEWHPKDEPSSMARMWNSYVNYLQRRSSFWTTVGEVVPALQKQREKGNAQPKLGQTFKTRFNGGVSPHRVFDSVDLKIDTLQRCKKLVPGSTLNDIVVSIVGGGLRRYLLGKDELTDESLIAGAPINVRQKSESRDNSSGNLISMMRIPLGTQIDDPVERLRIVNSGSVESKAYARSVGLKSLANVAQSLNPQLLVLGVRAIGSGMLKDVIAAPVHTMVSNVPGPRFDMYLRNARLTRVMGLGPLIDQVGLFHAVTSIGNSMSISFVACRETMPDSEFYSTCLMQAYRELSDRI